MEYKDDIVRVETREIGKTLKESAGSVQEAIDTCLFFQSEGRRLYGQTVNSELPDKELFTYRRPLGVCGIINACNFPSRSSILEDDSSDHVWKHLCVEVATRRTSPLIHADTHHA